MPIEHYVISFIPWVSIYSAWKHNSGFHLTFISLSSHFNIVVYYHHIHKFINFIGQDICISDGTISAMQRKESERKRGVTATVLKLHFFPQGMGFPTRPGPITDPVAKRPSGVWVSATRKEMVSTGETLTVMDIVPSFVMLVSSLLPPYVLAEENVYLAIGQWYMQTRGKKATRW